jgi:hypothetical protein
MPQFLVVVERERPVARAEVGADVLGGIEDADRAACRQIAWEDAEEHEVGIGIVDEVEPIQQVRHPRKEVCRRELGRPESGER